MRMAFIDRCKRPFGQTPHQPDLIAADMDFKTYLESMSYKG